LSVIESERYRDVEVELLAKQLEAFSITDKWAATRGGIGSGKTVAWAYWMWLCRVEPYPRANHFVIGADYEQLRRGFFQTMQTLLELNGLEAGVDYTYRDNPSPQIIFTKNKARIRSLSAELGQRVRSLEYQTLLLEEPQTWKSGNGEEVYLAAYGRLRHNPITHSLYPDMQPQGRMSFNPPAKSSWLFDVIERRWPKEGYKCLRFSLNDNDFVKENDPTYIPGLYANFPEEQWASEIEGHWKDVGGSVYYTFARALHCPSPEFPLDPRLPPMAWDIRPDMPICWSLDFNVSHMASNLSQWHHQNMVTKGLKPVTPETTLLQKIVGPQFDDWQRHLCYVLDELFLKDVGVPDVVAAFIEKYRALTGAMYGRIPVSIYGDPSGAGRSQAITASSSARSNWSLIFDYLNKAGIPWTHRIMMQAPAVEDRVNAMNEQFRAGLRRGMVIDEQQCPRLVIDLESVQWSKNENSKFEIDKKSAKSLELTHISDALGYMVYVERAMARSETVKLRTDWFGR
jgi:hypothetical protein